MKTWIGTPDHLDYNTRRQTEVTREWVMLKEENGRF